jgi:two-component system sensor histidine kinase UhpB
MSLRYRLILSIALMLLISLTIGGGVAWLHAVRSVATEMDAALEVGEHTVRTAIPYMGSGDDGTARLRQLVATFDDDRHLRATLVGQDGKTIAQSYLAPPPYVVPHWFAWALGRNEPSQTLTLPSDAGASAIRLDTDPRNEMTEVWTEFGDDIQILIVFGAVTFPMIYWILGRALAPLSRISQAFNSFGETVAVQPLAEAGPPEIVQLASGFNAMIDRLAEAETRNRRLNEQLSTIQEEERAEIARDLHDEIGPYLFVMGVDAAALQSTAEAAGQGDIAARLKPIRDGVAHIQQQVKSILSRLRSGTVAEFGLKQALENLAAFWRTRHDGVTITVGGSAFDKALGEVFEGQVYRIVQESLSNAMRHGKPRRVDIRIDAVDDHEVIVQVSDDGSGFRSSAETRGFGLRGMVERVTALGGDLDIRPGSEGAGVTVRARLPIPHPQETIAA